MPHMIGYGRFTDMILQHKNQLLAAAKTHAKAQAAQTAGVLLSHAKGAVKDKLGDSQAAKVANAALDALHDNFQAGLAGAGASFDSIGMTGALPFVVMVADPTPEEAQAASDAGIPDDAIAGGAFAPFSYMKSAAQKAVKAASKLGDEAVHAVKQEAGSMLENTIKPLVMKHKAQIEAAADKGANALVDKGFDAVETAIGAEVPELVGPMKALGIDKKLKKWLEGKVDNLIEQGIDELVGAGAMLPGSGAMLPGSGAMLPGSGAMLPGSGAMLPGSGYGRQLGFRTTDAHQHPSQNQGFHPDMLRRAR